MSKSQHTEGQMIGALKQLEAGRKAEDIGREVGVKHTNGTDNSVLSALALSRATHLRHPQLDDEGPTLTTC